ncbi:hypothetical protein C8R47DRAFT_1231379 [Mycena vitilis]|nr:hypothetical protein C8R47DRAFT_1231379 [Mycena vitilis]
MSPPPQPPAMTSTPPQPDIDSKIRLYAAIAALRRSRLPTNAQMADTLEYVKANSPVDEKKLSADGRKLVGDIRDILSTFSRLLQEKNKGEILQRFVWATRGVDTSNLTPAEGEKEKGKEDVEKAKRDAQLAAHHLRTLLSLVLTNAEMRKLITDVGTVGRDLLAKSAAKAAEAVSPSPDQLARADDPAPHDHFVDKDPLSTAKAKAKATTESATAMSDSSDSSDSEAERGPDGKKLGNLKKNIMGRFQSLHSSHKPKLDEGRTWLTDEFFPEERRERWIWRGKKVIVECQKHKDYQESVTWLLDTIDAWAARARDVGQGTKAADVTTQDPSLRSALDLLRTLLERIAGASGLRRWWTSVGGYVRKVLLQVGYVTEPACSDRARELRVAGRSFYDEKYKGHFDAVLDAASGPAQKALAQDFARLTRDLLFDGDGNFQFKKKLWEDVRGVILPTLVDKVGYIPIPRIEYTDDSFDLIVENLTLSGRHLFPNIVEVEAHNFARFSPYTAAAKGDMSRHEFTFTFAQVHADMRTWRFRPPQDGDQISDSGLADVATVTLASSKDTTSVLSVARVRVKVGSLKFRIRDTKHDLLYKTFTPLATRLYVDGQLVGVRDRMAEAKEGEEGTRTEVLAELFKRKKSDAASTVTATSTSSNSQFKVVASKQQSLLPESGHPSGWVNRTAGMEQLAERNDEWRSDAFDINAPKTSVPAVKARV